MSTETQNNALESAEPLVARDLLRRAKTVLQLVDKDKGSTICTGGLISDISTYLAAPAATQPALTQQTLDDVMAGIPARDAEIEALRKEVEALQAALTQPDRDAVDLAREGMEFHSTGAPEYIVCAELVRVAESAQLVDRSTEMQRNLIDETPNLQSQQQPVSGADGLVRQLCDALELARDCHGVMLMSDPPQEMWKGRGVDLVISEALEAAKAQLTGNPGQLDHLPDATKMVEPSGNARHLADNTRVGVLADSSYINGLRTGYVLGQAGNEAEYQKIIGATRAQISEARADSEAQPSGNSGELPDAARVPLDSLHADAVYLLSRVKQETLSIHDAALSIQSHIDSARAALAQQDATLHAEVLDMVRMLEANEWADHCGKSELGQRLEWAITALQNRIAELTEPSSQQDGGKVDEDPLQGAADWMVKDCGVKYIAELARRLSIGYNRATRLMEAARKENSNA